MTKITVRTAELSRVITEVWFQFIVFGFILFSLSSLFCLHRCTGIAFYRIFQLHSELTYFLQSVTFFLLFCVLLQKLFWKWQKFMFSCASHVDHLWIMNMYESYRNWMTLDIQQLKIKYKEYHCSWSDCLPLHKLFYYF